MAFVRSRLFLFGLIAGVLLSAMRAPLGLDWTQLAVVDSTTATLFRAAALVTLALFLDGRRTAFSAGTQPLLLLPAISAGFLLHGLFLHLPLQPGCRLGIGIAFVSATLLLWSLAGRIRKDDRAQAASDWTKPLLRSERAGLIAAGLGASVAIETVAQHVRLLGQGLPADDTVIAGFLLVWISLMSLCFGFSIAKSSARSASLSACALAFAAAASLYSLKFLSGLDRDGLWSFLKSVPLGRLDASSIGTWQVDAWISATSLVPIGLALSIAVLGARHPARLGAMLLGAALGLLIRPHGIEALVGELVFPAQADNTWAWQLVALGALIAGLGAMLCARGERGKRRILASVVGLAAGAAPLLIGSFSPIVIWSFSPWLNYDVQPELVIPSAVGVISVEQRPGGLPQVNLDRRRVVPSHYEQSVDSLRIAYSLGLVRPELRDSGQLRLLLLGQITPERDSFLRFCGVRRLDRSAAWFSAMPAIERQLFGPEQEPLGELISPGQARARLQSGDYDLVIALPSHAPDLSPRGAHSLPFSSAAAPIFGSLEVPEGTLGVAWVDGSAPIHTRSMGRWVMLAMDRMEHLSIGLVFGEPELESNPGLPLLFEAGPPLWPSSIWTETLSLLKLRVPARVFAPREAILERLGQGAQQQPSQGIALALKQHFALQTKSSPFDTAAYAVEWSEAVFDQLFAALGALEQLDPFSRALGEDLYWLLTEKRLADLAIVFGEALADKFAPWPVADRAIARAYQELLEPLESLRFWQRAITAAPYDLDAYLRYADAAIEAELPGQAADTLRQALKLQPGRFDLRRALGIALQKAKDPEAELMLNELLAMEPEDNLIRAALGLLLVPELEDEREDH